MVYCPSLGLPEPCEVRAPASFGCIPTGTVLVELSLVPQVNISESQYGFRKGRGTGMANALLNDKL